MSQIRCSLLGNALDYLVFAGQLARRNTSRSLKHAVANLGDGMELLLKARLEVRSWKLVVDDRTKTTKAQYKAGTFRSVDYKRAIKRLKKVCGVQITKGQKNTIERVYAFRNMVRHHSIRADQATVLSIITKTYSFALDFISAHFDADSLERLEHLLTKLRTLMGTFDAFVEHRMKDQEHVLNHAHGEVLDCPVCLQRALHATGEGSECAFCGHRGDGESTAIEWCEKNVGFRSLKDLLVEPYAVTCPECGSEALVEIGDVMEMSSTCYHCFQCGEGGEYLECTRCGEMYGTLPDEEPLTICGDCYYDVCHQDD